MSETEQNFEKLNPAKFKKLTGEPFWVMTDALFYLLGFEPPTLQDQKEKYLDSNPVAQKLKDYMPDAIEAGDLKVQNYDPFFHSHQTKEQEDEVIRESLYAGKVRPKEFVEWVKTLPPDIPILMAEMGQDIEAHIQGGGYTTPYIELMIKAIKSLEISDKNQPAKKEIIAWLDEQNPELSDREKQSIATFVRLPKMKIGGYHKAAKRKGDTL